MVAGGGLAAALGPGWAALAAPMAAFQAGIAMLQALLRRQAQPNSPALALSEHLQSCGMC